MAVGGVAHVGLLGAHLVPVRRGAHSALPRGRGQAAARAGRRGCIGSARVRMRNRAVSYAAVSGVCNAAQPCCGRRSGVPFLRLAAPPPPAATTHRVGRGGSRVSAVGTLGASCGRALSFLSSPLAFARVLMRWPCRLSGIAICTKSDATGMSRGNMPFIHGRSMEWLL